LQPGDKFRIRTTPLAAELSLAVYTEAVLAGTHVSVQNSISGTSEIFYKYASEAQLEFISPITRLGGCCGVSDEAFHRRADGTRGHLLFCHYR